MHTEKPAVTTPAPYTPHEPNIECASHLRFTLDPERLNMTVKRSLWLLRAMARRGTHFDAIAARGLSGVLIAPILAMELGKSLLVVRKPDEDCHSGNRVEGDYGARTYVVVDDFISSGKTVDNIVADLAKSVPTAVCVGMLKYMSIDDDDLWMGKSYAERLDRFFYKEHQLRAYADSMRGQHERAAEKRAVNQSKVLDSLAYVEYSKRLADPTTPQGNAAAENAAKQSLRMAMMYIPTFAWKDENA